MAAPKKTPPRRSPAPPSDRLLAAALTSLGEAVVVADGRWERGGVRIRFVNASLCNMTGWSAAELKGRAHGFLHGDQRHLAEVRRWLAAGVRDSVLTGEGYLKRRDGGRLYATWTFSLVTVPRGRPPLVAITYGDMTAKRRLQEALIHSQRLDAVNRLAGGVAHDFNNLLSVINGYCEILGGIPSIHREASRELGEIHRAGLQAAGLVRQLLAFSRRQTMEAKVIGLNRLVRDNAGILDKLLGADKSLVLALDAASDHVLVDPSQLQQVLLNLTLNARDALPAGGTVTITTANREIGSRFNSRLGDTPPGSYLQLSVRDNGRGMDEETLSHLFEPFFTTKDHGQGTGLGLALVYGVVQQCGGFISVSSAVGEGSTFEILLPEANEPLHPQPGAPGPLPSTRGRETVALVEPDAVVRKMVSGILSTDGYQVLAGTSPAKVAALVRRHKKPVDLFVGDTRRPEVEKFARALRAEHPAMGVLATDGAPGPALDWLPSRAQAHIAKPYVLGELLQIVRTLLDTKSPKRRTASKSAKARRAS